MPRIDPSRQDSMSESILRFYHNQNWAKIEFYMKFGRKSTKFHVFQINLIIRFVGYQRLAPKHSLCLHSPPPMVMQSLLVMQSSYVEMQKYVA